MLVLLFNLSLLVVLMILEEIISVPRVVLILSHGHFSKMLSSSGGLVMSNIFSPSTDNLLPLIFPFLLRLSPATLIPLWNNRGGKEGEMVIELHIKVLRV